MTSLQIRSSNFYSQIIDLIVLTSSFLLLVMITDMGSIQQVAADLVLYVVVVFISLRTCKRLVFEFVPTSNRITAVLLGNVSGLILGALSVILLDQLLPGIGESALIVILSSILAFFMLGTLSPMIKSSNRDIINH